MRTVLVVVVLVVFAALGVLDLVGGNYGTGAASICLGIANYLLLL